MHPLWFYKHQHDNRVRSKLYVACQRWWFQWRFSAILVNCAPSGEMHNYCTPHIIKENFENFLIHLCNYILLSQVYCVWQVVKTLSIILNNPVLFTNSRYLQKCSCCVRNCIYVILYQYTTISEKCSVVIGCFCIPATCRVGSVVISGIVTWSTENIFLYKSLNVGKCCVSFC